MYRKRPKTKFTSWKNSSDGTLRYRLMIGRYSKFTAGTAVAVAAVQWSARQFTGVLEAALAVLDVEALAGPDVWVLVLEATVGSDVGVGALVFRGTSWPRIEELLPIPWRDTCWMRCLIPRHSLLPTAANPSDSVTKQLTYL